jgi:translation initiation factor 1
MSSKNNKWKNREGIVYSTSNDFNYANQRAEQAETLPPQKQNLVVSLDKSGRAGKQVTLITGFVGTLEDMEKLTKQLKSKCGVGGSVKDRAILIQGDVRDKVVAILIKEGYHAKRGN